MRERGLWGGEGGKGARARVRGPRNDATWEPRRDGKRKRRGFWEPEARASDATWRGTRNVVSDGSY